MLNKTILMGRLTKNPVMSVSPGGATVTRFTLAIDRKFQKQGEEKQTDFLNIISFGKTAEFANKYFAKGKLAIVVGSIQIRTWDGQDGKRNYTTEIVAEDVSFGASKKDEIDSCPDNNFMPVDDDAPLF